jgi:hypothetical protein
MYVAKRTTVFQMDFFASAPMPKALRGAIAIRLVSGNIISVMKQRVH